MKGQDHTFRQKVEVVCLKKKNINYDLTLVQKKILTEPSFFKMEILVLVYIIGLKYGPESPPSGSREKADEFLENLLATRQLKFV